MALRRTPFFHHHVQGGARMVPYAGFEMPLQYSGLKEEHLQVRRSVGLFDVSHMGQVRVRGPGAEDALQWLLSNAIRRIQDGAAQYNALCNERGGIVDDVFVYRIAADDFLVCVNAANRDKAFAWMQAHNPCPDRAEITDEGDDWAQIAVQGPDAVHVVSRLTDLPVVDLPRHRFLIGAFAGVEGCLVARTGYTGEDGFEVFLPADKAEPVWPAVLEAGAEYGILPAGLGARDTLRLEAGNCLYGNELGEDISPLQAGLGWLVKLNKPGGFLGAEAIAARQATDTRQLVRLVVDGKRIPREGMDVRLGEQVVGRTTSGTLGPSVGRGIAMAYVDRAHTAPGTELVIDVRGKSAPAVVIKGPSFTAPTA